MDIARIRKKLKKLKTSEEQKEAISREGTEDSQEAVRESSKEKGRTPPEIVSSEIEPERTEVKEIEIIAFKVANEEYGVRVSELQEILRSQRITTVPRSPKYLKGVTFLRGRVLPVIDLKERLGLKGEMEKKQKIMVLLTPKEPVGIIVGSVLDIIRFPETELLQPPATLNENEKSFIEGVVKINNKFISILNVKEIVKMEAI